MQKHLAALCLVTASTSVTATELHLALSDQSLELGYQSDIQDRATSNLNWLYHKDGGNYLELGLHGKGRMGPLVATLGANLFAVDAEEKGNGGEGLGLAVGGGARYFFTEQLTVEGNVHYAPSVTSFADVDHLIAINSQIAFMVFEGTSLYGGYRVVDVDLDNGDNTDATIHEGAYIGFRISF